MDGAQALKRNSWFYDVKQVFKVFVKNFCDRKMIFICSNFILVKVLF